MPTIAGRSEARAFQVLDPSTAATVELHPQNQAFPAPCKKSRRRRSREAGAAMTGTASTATRQEQRALDPRLYQIAMLGCLLAYGMLRLDFEITAARAATMLATTLLTQYACTRIWKLPAFDPRSAWISGLSLCLLLRTNSVPLAIVAAVITISSKF